MSLVKAIIIAALVAGCAGALLIQSLARSGQVQPLPIPLPKPSAIEVDLGGRRAVIPPAYMFLNTFEDEALYDWRRSPGAPLQKLTSFGFQLAYPGFLVHTLKTESRDKDRYKLSVLVLSGTRCLSCSKSKLENEFNQMKRHLRYMGPDYGFKQAEPIWGLQQLKPYGGELPNHLDSDIFYKLDNAGRAVTAIRCSNATYATAPCEHKFSLHPWMQSSVSILYNRKLMPHWAEIQQNVERIVKSFTASNKNINLNE